MSYNLTPDHLDRAQAFLRSLKTDDKGLPLVDIDQFWSDNEIAGADPFGKDIPQAAFGAICNWECVFAEMGIEQDWWRWFHDPAWRHALGEAYDDRAERIVGRRLLNVPPPGEPGSDYQVFMPIKKLHDVFEMEEVWDTTSQSYWLMESVTSERDLEALLDRVDARDVREFILPSNWDTLKGLLKSSGLSIPLYRAQRGPVTFATSMVGVEFLLMLILDNPDLAARLRDTILRVMRDIARVLDEESGYTPKDAPNGWYWLDDNCYLLNPAMYEFFALPIVQGMFDTYSPAPEHYRGQHSDSAMGHLLPLLATCDLRDCNFGPTLTVSEIRSHMPTTVIQGQLAPFTYSRDERLSMVAEFIRDFDQAREQRGLNFSTAGSINNGSRLEGMRLFMATIQQLGRYET
jgi:uroporphyrinogen decarboxylase